MTSVWIHPGARGASFSAHELRRYSALLALLIRRDFLLTHRQTRLGAAWLVARPLLVTLTLTVVFAKAVRLSTNGVPPVLFYLAGTVLWSYFAQIVGDVGNCLRAGAPLLTKTYFPRLVLPLSVTISKTLGLAVPLAVFFVFVAGHMAGGTLAPLVPRLGIAVLVLVLLGALATGAGLCLALANVRYRDTQQVSGLFLQFWMAVTPVVYPATAVAEEWRWMLRLNPVASLVESFRAAFLGTPMPPVPDLLLSTVMTAAILAVALFAFRRMEPLLADYL